MRTLEGIARMCLSGLVLATVCVWVQGPAEAQPPPRDVGLVTALSGEVIYWSQAEAQGRAEPFMKVRIGDRFEVGKDSSVQIVFFQVSRQELWRGPASFKVGETQGEALGGTTKGPEVTVLPSGTGQGIQRVPTLLRRAGLSRVGAMQVRGTPGARAEEAAPPGEAALSQEERAEIEAARETYKAMRQKAQAGDLTPELFLLGILSEYEQYGEMEALLREALSRHPGNDVLKDLAGWVQSQRAKSR
jgi:hypothetical protein